MEKLFKRMMIPSILTSLAMLALGIIIFINPETTLEFIAKVIGGVVIALGVIGIIQYITHRDEDSFKLNLLYIITTIVLGIIVMYNYKAVSSIIPIILGACITLDSIIKLRMTISVKNAGMTKWGYPFVMAFITLVIGIFLIFNPFAGAVTIMKLGAALIIAYSVIEITQDFLMMKYLD